MAKLLGAHPPAVLASQVVPHKWSKSPSKRAPPIGC